MIGILGQTVATSAGQKSSEFGFFLTTIPYLRISSSSRPERTERHMIKFKYRVYLNYTMRLLR